MEVNDELGELARALDGGLSLLRAGGRFVVITFESLTDRTVKRFFAAHAGRDESLQGGGSRWEGVQPRVRLVARRAARASAAEVARNARARSAKMRVAERMGR
jgi:16S rRNA (cytosine1402-N4)-methyltransferase